MSVCAKLVCFFIIIIIIIIIFDVFFLIFHLLFEWLGFFFLCLNFFFICWFVLSVFCCCCILVWFCLFIWHGVCFGFGSLFILVFCLSIVVIVFGLFFIVCVVVHNREKPFVFFAPCPMHELRSKQVRVLIVSKLEKQALDCFHVFMA